MKITLLLFMSVFYTVIYSQKNPPPMAMPEESNEAYIDTLVKICRYDKMFETMKRKKIEEYALKENWSKTYKDSIDKEIKYSDISDWVFYNAHSDKTKDELIKLIEYYRSLSEEEIIKEFPKYEYIIWVNFDNRITAKCEGK